MGRFSRRETLTNHQHGDHPLRSDLMQTDPEDASFTESLYQSTLPLSTSGDLFSSADYMMHNLPMIYGPIQPSIPFPSAVPVVAMDQMQYSLSSEYLYSSLMTTGLVGSGTRALS
jgi:hypothetical protein